MGTPDKYDYDEYRRLVEKGWSEWCRLKASVAKKIPEFPGIYEIGITKPVPRLKGATRTLYIGCSEKRDLRARIQGLLRPRGRHIARKRLQRVRDELSETLWIRTQVTGIGEAKDREKARIEEFEQDHLELPPCNHKGLRATFWNDGTFEAEQAGAPNVSKKRPLRQSPLATPVMLKHYRGRRPGK